MSPLGVVFLCYTRGEKNVNRYFSTILKGKYFFRMALALAKMACIVDKKRGSCHKCKVPQGIVAFVQELRMAANEPLSASYCQCGLGVVERWK